MRGSQRYTPIHRTDEDALTRAIDHPGSPWENGYCERCNGKLRDECLNGELFNSLKEAQI